MDIDKVRACAERLARLVWPLDRPLVGYDLETTGLAAAHDRIIEIGAVKVAVDGKVTVWQSFVNPERPIPKFITEKTGITDAMVAGAPVFDAKFGGGLAAALTGVDFAGYNLRFDLSFTAAQTERVGVPWRYGAARVLDGYQIWSKSEPRDLSSCSERFRKRPHEGAHRAAADVAVAMDAIAGQLEEYPNLPRNVAELHAFLNPRDPDWIDREGKFKWIDGEARVNFGTKHRGSPVRLVERSFWRWMIGGTFDDDAKDIAKAALEGRYPVRGLAGPPPGGPPPDLPYDPEDSPF